MKAAVEHPAEIWFENTGQGPRLKHIAVFTASDGTKNFIVISHQIGETKADIVTGVPKRQSAIDKARTGKLLYVNPENHR